MPDLLLLLNNTCLLSHPFLKLTGTLARLAIKRSRSYAKRPQGCPIV
jgi:hypothetical protein